MLTMPDTKAEQRSKRCSLTGPTCARGPVTGTPARPARSGAARPREATTAPPPPRAPRAPVRRRGGITEKGQRTIRERGGGLPLEVVHARREPEPLAGEGCRDHRQPCRQS